MENVVRLGRVVFDLGSIRRLALRAVFGLVVFFTSKKQDMRLGSVHFIMLPSKALGDTNTTPFSVR